jgi:DNA-binding transcriptional MocR family regulator
VPHSKQVCIGAGEAAADVDLGPSLDPGRKLVASPAASRSASTEISPPSRRRLLLRLEPMSGVRTRPLISGRTARELSSSIEARIRDGDLLPGAQLPTIRALAGEVGVSPMTVGTAYRELRRRGLVSAAGRRGTSVSAQPPLPVSSAPLVPPGTRDLATGNPDPELLPDLSAALTRFDPRPRAHPFNNKLDRLIELAQAAFAADGIATPALAVVGGALDGVERVLTAHLSPGDAVAVEDPSFPRVLDLLRALGLMLLPVAVDDDGPLPDELEGALAGGAKALILTPRWQNPFGARWTAARTAELRTLLDDHPDVLVVEDDFAGFLAQEQSYSVAAGRERWAILRSASKAFGADFRLAVMTGDPATVARVEGRQLLATGWVSHLLQELVADLWADATVKTQVVETANVYTARRLLMVDALAARGIRAHGVSGLNVWVPVAEESATVAGMLQRGWAITAGERWRLTTAPAVRITISTLRDGESATVADDLAQALERRPAAFSS